MARGPLTAAALLLYGAAVAAFGMAPAYAFAVAVLVVAGACYLALASTLNTTIQLQVDETMRGKVISLYLMGLTGSVPLGALAQGWLAQHVGPRPTVAGAGLLLVAAALWLRAGDRFAADGRRDRWLPARPLVGFGQMSLPWRALRSKRAPAARRSRAGDGLDGAGAQGDDTGRRRRRPVPPWSRSIASVTSSGTRRPESR